MVLVDDDPLVRAGLRMILGGAPDIEVVGEAGDGLEALTVIEDATPRVVLMDIRMPRRDGIEATRLLVERQRHSGRLGAVRVIVLTTFDTDDLVLEALRIGASGFLLKDTPPERLVAAVRTCRRPAHPLPQRHRPAHRHPVPVDHSRRDAARARLPSPRANEDVAVAIGRGQSNAEIAAELYMSVPTVKAHVSRLLAKLDADNRVQVALTVHDADLS